jgi:SWIM zinc finger
MNSNHHAREAVRVAADDPRGPKAVELALRAGGWLKCRARNGQKYYGVPSSTPDRYYLTTQHACTCPDFERRALPCKHIYAVRLHCELVHEQHTLVAKARLYDDIFKHFEDD